MVLIGASDVDFIAEHACRVVGLRLTRRAAGGEVAKKAQETLKPRCGRTHIVETLYDVLTGASTRLPE